MLSSPAAALPFPESRSVSYIVISDLCMLYNICANIVAICSHAATHLLAPLAMVVSS